MPLGRGSGVNSVGWEGGKNRDTVTASLYLAFTELVAPATATPDWSRDNRVHQSTAYRWQLEWQEVAFITSRLSPKWHQFQKNFLKTDFDRLSASSPRGGGGTPIKIGWGCAARFPKPLPYLWPKPMKFPTLFMAWRLNQTLFQSCVIISSLVPTRP